MIKKAFIPDFKINYVVQSVSEPIGYGNLLLNIPEAWKRTKGEGIKVGVIDTGLPIHRDLNTQIKDYANFTDSPVEDLVCGHSSHVSGIIAAIENNEGIVGASPLSELYIAKALGDDGSGSDEWLARAIDWCVSKKVDIVNMSLGAPAQAEKYFVKTKNAIVKGYEKGVVFVCAAGNENASRVGVPAKFPQCISVAAVNSKKQRASFSNRGPGQGFAAPGVDILSTYINDSFASLSGTSMACPFISGICALILSEHRYSDCCKKTPISSQEDLIEHIKKMCYDLGPVGHDHHFGHGLPVFGKLDIPNVRRESLLRRVLNFLF